MPSFSVFSLVGFTCSFVRCAIKERNTSSGWLSDGKWQLLFYPSQVIAPRSVSELYSQSVGCDWCGMELLSQSVFSLFQKVKRGHCGYFFRVEYVWTLILAFCPKWEIAIWKEDLVLRGFLMIAGDYSWNTVSWMCWIFRYEASLGSDLSFILLKKSGVLKWTLPCERNGTLVNVHHVTVHADFGSVIWFKSISALGLKHLKISL